MVYNGFNPVQRPLPLSRGILVHVRLQTPEGGKMKSRTIIRTMRFQPRDAVFAISNEREYQQAVHRLVKLVEEVGDALDDPRYRLIETLSVVIDAYDRERYYSSPETSSVARREARGR
jgi:hypothetical protein